MKEVFSFFLFKLCKDSKRSLQIEVVAGRSHMKESGDVGLLFAPLIPFPAHKFWEQMETKGTRKFRFSAPQPIVYDACKCVTLHCCHLLTPR